MEVIFFILILLFSVILHELAHGYAAEALGDPTPRLAGRLTLNPVPHLDLWGSFLVPGFLILMNVPFLIGWAKPVPFNPAQLSNKRWGGALVAIAGPVTNILLAIVTTLLVHGAAAMDILTPGIALIGSIIVLINIVLAIFNLIPVPPLDGHHILFAVLPASARSVKMFLMRYWLFVLLLVFVFVWSVFTPVVTFFYELLLGSIVPLGDVLG